jgi:asparagine synthase (glutamine-hydrolysing)
MCGIVGWVDFDRDLRNEIATLEAMTETVRQRGPDDGGTWHSVHAALGHRRLAVIDIEGGKQPFVSRPAPAARPTVLVYGGEIYNFHELRTELKCLGHQFHTRSDTEVLLRSYEQWGTGCVERLNGMFAFAIWDSEREQLLLARDRMGVKPLYYYSYRGGVVFASEPKGIMANPCFTPEVDIDALPILLNARLSLPGETPLHGLKEVKPGHVVIVDRLGCHEYPYWRLVSREHHDDLRATVGKVRRLLEDIVQRQLVADVPLSLMLSGGLDSTTIAALATRLRGQYRSEPLDTFCVEFADDAQNFHPTELRPEVDAPYARAAAEYLSTEHHPVVLQAQGLADVLPKARQARDLPCLGQFDASMYLLFTAIRRSSTVALCAESADELFGGYPWYHNKALVERDHFPWMGDAPRLADCLAADLLARVRPEESEKDRYHTLLAQVPTLAGEDPVNARMREVLFCSLQRPLTHLLDRQDRMSMAVGLEVRVPFCDHRLVEYVWNIPWSMKNADGRWKSVLRMAAEDLVPAETLRRPKSGYPGSHNPEYDDQVISAVRSVVRDPTSPLHGVFDEQRVDDLITKTGHTMTGFNTANVVLPILETDVWMRDYKIGFR